MNGNGVSRKQRYEHRNDAPRSSKGNEFLRQAFEFALHRSYEGAFLRRFTTKMGDIPWLGT